MQTDVSIEIITHSEDLPPALPGNKFFHSAEFFRIAEKTKGQSPYMVVARRGGVVVACLLALLRRRGSLIPPYLFSQGRIYGEGCYADNEHREELFQLMLQAITRKLRHKLCMYIEFSDLSTKMFSYKHFRAEGYFPVRWMEIHNSLHSMPPEDRLSDKMLARIEKASKMDTVTKEVTDFDEFRAFYKLLHAFYRFKVRRYLPPERQFFEFYQSGNCQLQVTEHNGKVIGGSATVNSGGNTYLWFMASRRKSYHHLHPETLTVWNALKSAYEQGSRHFYFMDVGLPYQKNLFREFILSFGGKPVGTYRWFRFTFSWMNRILSLIYKE